MKNEIPLKQWVYEEAERQKCHIGTIRKRLKGGKYPNLVIRRVNYREQFVQQPSAPVLSSQ